MHDIKDIRADLGPLKDSLRKRSFYRVDPVIDELSSIDDVWKAVTAHLQSLQTTKNERAKQMGDLKRAIAKSSGTSEDMITTVLGTFQRLAMPAIIERFEADGRELRNDIEQKSDELRALDAKLLDILSGIPNLLDETVPEGRSDQDNKQVKVVGTLRNFAFTPKQHFEIGEALGLMDFADAAKIAGSRFTILQGQLARLERALGQFMLDVHTTEHGYTETSVPLLVNDAAMFGTGQLPKFAEDLFKTTDGRWLIPTAEVSLTNLVANDITAGWKLPIRLTALTPCFRSEAGSAGRDVRGMLRQHQFTKVEMVSITHPDASAEEHERMTRCAETILERLELPYRRMLLCAGDTGFSAAKTYDLEVWLPGQGQYREISSCSNTRAFQARRMNARYREADGKTLGFVHTLNGSGVAVGRALIAVLENYQNEDGSVNIPDILRPYMGNLAKISAPERA
jgi:seryl-tRNA synthetase